MGDNEINPFNAPFTREEQLAFCAICLNRKKDAIGNYICSLTNDFANFKRKCDDFVIDVGEKTRFTREIEEDIEREIQERTVIDKYFSNAPYLERIKANPSYANSAVSKKPSLVLHGTMAHQYFVFTCLILLTSIFSAGVIFGSGVNSLKVERGELVVLVILIALLTWSAYVAFVITRMVIRMNGQGMLINEKRMHRWSNIENVCWKIKPSRGGHHYTMRVYLFSGGQVEYDVSSIDVYKLGHYIRWHLDNSKI